MDMDNNIVYDNDDEGLKTNPLVHHLLFSIIVG